MNGLPDAIARFVLESIDSVGHLEALLLLSRDGEQRWTVSDIARRLYVSEQQAELILQDLEGRQLIERDGARYHLHAGTAELAALLADLRRVYSTHLIQITNIIHAKPRSRVQEFAEAFNLKRGKK